MDKRVTAYLEAALFAETVLLPVPEEALRDGKMFVDSKHPCYGLVDGAPLDDYFLVDDFDEESVVRACADVAEFFQWLDESGLAERAARFADDGRIAYDFWLTRNGHGAGFFDGDYDNDEDELGDILTAKCEEFGELYIIVTNRGELEFL